LQIRRADVQAFHAVEQGPMGQGSWCDQYQLAGLSRDVMTVGTLGGVLSIVRVLNEAQLIRVTNERSED
ncbi:hypothetical protein, partial [Stutzerimonas nitrititolerans]|uniref:hypothetical protein n=1 Tax=Stutzerimonas nitrititolerans TaxID=2482751 RepID=UPI0028AF3F77